MCIQLCATYRGKTYLRRERNRSVQPNTLAHEQIKLNTEVTNTESRGMSFCRTPWHVQQQKIGLRKNYTIEHFFPLEHREKWKISPLSCYFHLHIWKVPLQAVNTNLTNIIRIFKDSTTARTKEVQVKEASLEVAWIIWFLSCHLLLFFTTYGEKGIQEFSSSHMVLKMGSARITTDIRSYFTSWRNVKKTGAHRLYYREWQVRFMKECFQCVEYFVLFLVCRSGVGGTS